MQCMWYENTIADSYHRQKELGRALRKWHAVDEHFETIFEDQFDFHNYCLRKMTLRAYIDMLRWQDNVRGHRFYFRAAQHLVKTYLSIPDNPALADKSKALSDANLTEEERKALKKELRDAKKKEFREKEAAEKPDPNNEKLGNQIDGKKGDDDPDGVKLLQTKDPLGDANKFLKNLQLYRPDEIATQLLAIQVYTRKKRYLLVFRALKKALTINRHNPQANLDLITTLHSLKNLTLDPIVKQVIDLECKEEVLGANQPLAALVDNFLKEHSYSLPHRFAAAKCYLVLEGKEKLSNATKQKVLQLCNSKLSDLKIQPLHQECRPVYEFLLTFDKDAASEFKSQCAQFFPLTPFFNDSKESKYSSSESTNLNQSNHIEKSDTETIPKTEDGDKKNENEKQSKNEKRNKKGSTKNKSRTSSETNAEN